MSQKMLKGLMRSLKKNKKSNNIYEQSPASIKFEKFDSDVVSTISQCVEEGDENSGRRTPLLTWTASLDNLVKSCKNERKTKNLCGNDASLVKDMDDSNDPLDFTNMADEYKEELRFDSPTFCSTERRIADCERQIHHNAVMDDSYDALVNMRKETIIIKGGEEEKNSNHPVPMPRRIRSTSISSQASHPLLRVSRDPHTPIPNSLCSSAVSMSAKSSSDSSEIVGRSLSSKNSKNALDESLALSSIGTTVRGRSSENVYKKEAATPMGAGGTNPRDCKYEPSHLYGVFSSSAEKWIVMVLTFDHRGHPNPIAMTTDEFDRPFVLHPGSCLALKEGDMFLEMNEVLLIQMDLGQIVAFLNSLQEGCQVRCVVLRKER